MTIFPRKLLISFIIPVLAESTLRITPSRGISEAAGTVSWRPVRQQDADPLRFPPVYVSGSIHEKPFEHLRKQSRQNDRHDQKRLGISKDEKESRDPRWDPAIRAEQVVRSF